LAGAQIQDAIMITYHVSFFKNLMSSDGHPFKVLQRVIEIRYSKSREMATKAAEHRFERDKGVSNWRIFADAIETEIKDDKENKADTRSVETVHG
jgi:hypothetical protein